MKKIKDLLRWLMLLYKNALYQAAKILERTEEKTVIFEAFQGRSVSCNPKALYEEMKTNEKYKDYQFIWSLRNTNRLDLKGENTSVVKFESFQYYRALAKAKYWIFNSNTRPFLKPRKEQIFVQTWHGTPLKKIGCDVEKTGNAMTKFSEISRIYTKESKKISYMISPSEYCTKKFISAFRMKEANKEDRVLTTGYPRNDYLFKATKAECQEIKKQLQIPQDKKVILYAPTFRDNKYSAAAGFEVANFIDFCKAEQSLKEDYVILFRAHYFISQKLDVSQYKGFVYDVSKVEDINTLYVISDILVTDYSSVFFDYANLKRPIIFYMTDYEEYKNNLRDFYFDVEQLPGPVVREQEELVKYIKKFSQEFEPDEKYCNFNKKYNYLDGASTSKKVLDMIIENKYN